MRIACCFSSRRTLILLSILGTCCLILHPQDAQTPPESGSPHGKRDLVALGLPSRDTSPTKSDVESPPPKGSDGSDAGESHLDQERENSQTPLCVNIKAVLRETRLTQANRDVATSVAALKSFGVAKHPVWNLTAMPEMEFFRQECRLLRWITSLRPGEVVKIVIFGNSKTEATDAKKCPGKCPVSNDCKVKHHRSPFQIPFRCNTPSQIQAKRYYCCGWVLQFVVWLQRMFPETIIEHHPVTEGGLNTLKVGQRFERLLEQRKIKLSRSDMVLVNLGSADSKTTNCSLLFRKLLATPALPLVLADYPGSGVSGSYWSWAKEIGVPVFRWFNWVVLATQSGILSAAWFKMLGLHRVHPPWDAHQLLADTLAFGLLLHAQSIVCSPLKLRTVANSACQELSPVKDSISCSGSSIETADFFDAKELIPDEGKNVSLSHGAQWAGDNVWNLYEDRVGKPGWIATLEQVGSHPRKGNLTFLFAKAKISSESSSIHVDISYMRTWKDAGWADVFVCGLFLGQLDALWDKPYSIPDVASFDIPLKKCTSTAAKDFVSVTFVHVAKIHTTDSQLRQPGMKFKLLTMDVCAK